MGCTALSAQGARREKVAVNEPWRHILVGPAMAPTASGRDDQVAGMECRAEWGEAAKLHDCSKVRAQQVRSSPDQKNTRLTPQSATRTMIGCCAGKRATAPRPIVVSKAGGRPVEQLKSNRTMSQFPTVTSSTGYSIGSGKPSVRFAGSSEEGVRNFDRHQSYVNMRNKNGVAKTQSCPDFYSVRGESLSLDFSRFLRRMQSMREARDQKMKLDNEKSLRRRRQTEIYQKWREDLEMESEIQKRVSEERTWEEALLDMRLSGEDRPVLNARQIHQIRSHLSRLTPRQQPSA